MKFHSHRPRGIELSQKEVKMGTFTRTNEGSCKLTLPLCLWGWCSLKLGEFSFLTYSVQAGFPMVLSMFLSSWVPYEKPKYVLTSLEEVHHLNNYQYLLLSWDGWTPLDGWYFKHSPLIRTLALVKELTFSTQPIQPDFPPVFCYISIPICWYPLILYTWGD